MRLHRAGQHDDDRAVSVPQRAQRLPQHDSARHDHPEGEDLSKKLANVQSFDVFNLLHHFLICFPYLLPLFDSKKKKIVIVIVLEWNNGRVTYFFF